MTQRADNTQPKDFRAGARTVEPEEEISAKDTGLEDDGSLDLGEDQPKEDTAAPSRPMKASTMEDVDLPMDLEKYIDPKPYIRLGAIVALLFFGGLAAWSIFAPLKKGATAAGIINVQSNRKTIQHLEGGIIRGLFIKEGDLVKKGQVLLEIESARADANLKILRARRQAAMARLARLEAQRNNLEAIVFPPDVLNAAAADTEMAAIVDAEKDAFESQRNTLDNRREILTQQIGQMGDQIKGFDAQISSYDEQLDLISQEIKDVTFLHDKGLIESTRLRALQRTSASLKGQIEANRANIAQTRQRISETRLQIIGLDNSYREQIITNLREVRETLADLNDELTAAGDVVRRLEIRAPENGRIVNLAFHTIGGVVRSGQVIAELVPNNDHLIVTAKLSPLVIDSVHPGLEAQVVLSAFNRRRVPHMHGTVIQVSADRITDQRTGAAYYEAQIEIDQKDLAQIEDLELYPGMPAEVIIVTGERSAFEYFINPLEQAARRGFVSE